MTNINWKLRVQNKVTLTAIVVGIIALIYQVIRLCGLTPPVEYQAVIDTAMMVIDLLVLMGVVVDPTTDGAKDSARALSYEKP